MLMARLAVVLVAAAACVLAWRSGGGAEGATPPPRAEELDGGTEAVATASAVLPPPLPGGQGYEVALRLVEIASTARFEEGNAAMAHHLLGAHWRKMRPAWFATKGDNARFVSTVRMRACACGLRTNAACS